MPKILLFLLIFLIGETLATILFKMIQLKLEGNIYHGIDRSVFKGMLERFFLFLALIYNFPQALIAFAAIKLGTRFVQEENKISNDYFFIGNMTSLLIVILYIVLWNHFIA